MKKTIKDCKRFKILFCAINALIGIAGLVGLALYLVLKPNIHFLVGILVPTFVAATCFYLLIWALIHMEILVYEIDKHEVVCFLGFSHNFMIIDQKVVARDGALFYMIPTLRYKLNNKQLEFHQKSLKVDGQDVMPINK